MTTEQAITIMKHLSQRGVGLEPGLSDREVSEAETKFGLSFPPDLRTFLQVALPLDPNTSLQSKQSQVNKFINWRLGLQSEAEAEHIHSRLDWPLDGILFDMKQNDFWMEDWGEKPDDYSEQVVIATNHYKTYPKLIPIYLHRYIPGRPNVSGNPVFSVYQTDIIYYGYDLPSYFANEFHFTLPEGFDLLERPNREIEFWSSFT